MVFLFSVGSVATASPRLAELAAKHGIQLGASVDPSVADYLAPGDTALPLAVGDKEAKRDNLFCQVGFTVSHHRNFTGRGRAVSFCNDLNGFVGLGNFCRVRGYGNNFFGAGFRYQGVANRGSFVAAFQAVLAFLAESNLLNDIFQLVPILRGDRGC